MYGLPFVRTRKQIILSHGRITGSEYSVCKGAMDARYIEQRIQELLEPVLLSEGMELAELKFRKGGGRWFLRVFIDKESGVGVDDCANISRQLGEILEVEEIIDKSYVLEVSSPGMDRPLKKLEDYRRFSGRKARINTSTPVEGKKFFSGRLKGLEEDAVLIEEDNGRLVPIPFARITKSRLEVEF